MCFLVYNRVSASHHVVFDPDFHGLLGYNIWHGHGLCFDPDRGPTVYRGPLYPAFLAAVAWLSGGWIPGGIWIAQSVLHGLTCIGIYALGRLLWNRKTGLIAGIACAVYPILFWYSPRALTEALLMPLTVALAFGAVSFRVRPRISMALFTGIVLGLLCLGKSTYLPLALVLPFACLTSRSRAGIARTVLIGCVALAVVAPWTMRNFRLTGRIIPVHTGTGFNMMVGNVFGRQILLHPLGYDTIWNENVPKIMGRVKGLTGLQYATDVAGDKILKQAAIKEILHDPALIVKKILVAGAMFWYIGEIPSKTIAAFLLRLPILIMAAIALRRLMRERDFRLLPVIVIVGVYWLCHLPFAPPARLSTPIMPLLVLVAVSCLTIGRRDPGVKTVIRQVHGS